MATNQKLFALTKTIQKIAIFKGFDGPEVVRVLQMCRMRHYHANEEIYAQGEASHEMLILLRGQLAVRGPGGVEYARIGPGEPVGEMGMLTQERRSADIVALESCTALALTRKDLAVDGGRMLAKVQQNVISVLCARLAQTNQLVAEKERELEALRRNGDAAWDEDEDEVWLDDE